MIANRKMKKNHPMTLPVYTALVLFFASLIGITMVDGKCDLSYAWSLSFATWLLFLGAGILTIFENASKFLAFRYHEAAPLQKLAFLPNVWSFTIDGLFYDKVYAVM